ncbi:MAG TPA: hypothetical protein DCZ71_07295 [Ruminococcus sp.]|nr:hypothetical protein [Ruminococcus sp.]
MEDKQTPPEDDFVLGDVNEDGLIDSGDASEILADYANVSTGGQSRFSEKQKKAADVNNDGVCDSGDASAILGYYAYVSTTSDTEKKSLEEFASA